MLNKMRRAMRIACTILAFAAVPLLAQGVAHQDYTGLDITILSTSEGAEFVGVRAAEFLTIPVGARGIAMGSAYSAVADDISAIWWNPAGLGFLTNREAMFTIVDYTLDITYSYGAFASPIGDGRAAVGGFFGYLDVPDIEITTVSNPEGTGRYYNAYDFQMGGSFAYNLSDRFVAGLSMKYVHQDMYSNIGGGAFAMDAGVVYHTELAEREIRFTFAVQNLGTNITMRGSNLLQEIGPESKDGGLPSGYENYGSDPYAFIKRSNREIYYKTHTYRLPTTVKIAMCYNIYSEEKVNWLAAAEYWRPNNLPITYSTGTEVNYDFTPFLSGALRMGWLIQMDEYTGKTDQMGFEYFGDDPTLRGLSFGGGIQQKWAGKAVRFSYAYRNKGRLSSDNFFTVSISF